MVLKRLNVLGHCGWGSDFAIVGCDKPKGHSDPHRVGAAAGFPAGLGRAEQENYKERMKGRIIGQTPRPKE
jgi:hypothetical protein